MPQTEYNRYELLTQADGSILPMPFVLIPTSNSDKYISWNNSSMRLDIISQRYYGNATYGWLLLIANPLLRNEFDIPDGFTFRIPFPLNQAISFFESGLNSTINR